ncbi:NAD-P-binding protein [Trametes punicea]|nr:NAD-P-binding protein [Trametes punicea]
MVDIKRLSTRVALVTGAAQGIGEAIALRLAEDGLDVAVVDLPHKRDELEAIAGVIREKGRRSLTLYGDVSLEADVEAMVKKTTDELGSLDVMVANAGILKRAPIVELTVESWEAIIAVNARGVMLAIKHAARQMITQGGGGRIIAASSAAGTQGLRNLAAYSASKFAIRGLVHTAATELRPYDITVNAYCPGAIKTNMGGQPDEKMDDGKRATISNDIGMPSDIKPAEPEVIGSFVSYLAKTESHYITGQSVHINGGWMMN